MHKVTGLHRTDPTTEKNLARSIQQYMILNRQQRIGMGSAFQILNQRSSYKNTVEHVLSIHPDKAKIAHSRQEHVLAV